MSGALETIRAARAHQRQMLREADRARHDAAGTLLMPLPELNPEYLEMLKLMADNRQLVRDMLLGNFPVTRAWLCPAGMHSCELYERCRYPGNSRTGSTCPKAP